MNNSALWCFILGIFKLILDISRFSDETSPLGGVGMVLIISDLLLIGLIAFLIIKGSHLLSIKYGFKKICFL